MAIWMAQQRSSSLRISLALAVMATTTLALAIFAIVSYGIGRGRNTEQRFFYSWIAPTLDEATVVCPVEYALRTDDKNDVVFVGDSTCRTGLDPERFERLTGLSAYNLGSLRGIGAAGFVITAKAYLLHHPKPRALVLCVTPTCFEIDSGTFGGPLPGRFAANYGPEVSEVVPKIDRISYFSKRGVWSVWPRVDAAKGWLHGQDVRDVPLTGHEAETYHTLQRKTRDSRGFFPLPGSQGPAKGIGGAEPTLIRDEWDKGIRRIAEICDGAGVPLLIQFAPISAQIANARDFSPLETWSRELESTYWHTTVARPIVLIYNSPLMWDSLHLNSAGVEKFLLVVAKDVQASLAK
jgi:hypothetical protein